jgi:hypothetical protein
MNNTGNNSETMPKKITHNIQLLLKVYNHQLKGQVFYDTGVVFHSSDPSMHAYTVASASS